MAKATTRIKFGEPKEKKLDADKSHLKIIEPGETVPKDVLDEETARFATDAGQDFEPVFDPDDPESYAGEEAARQSKMMAPDHPDRPASIEGEESFKVGTGGALGRDTRGPMRPADEDAQRLVGGTVKTLGSTIGEVPEGQKDARKSSVRKGSTRSAGGSGQASGQSAQGREGNEGRE